MLRILSLLMLGACSGVVRKHELAVVPCSDTESGEAEGKASNGWSPLFSAVRAVYNRSPVSGAVNVVTPQFAVVANAVRVGVNQIPQHVTLLTGAATAAAILPIGPQQLLVKTVAACGLLKASYSMYQASRLALAPLDDTEGRWAVVTGCGEISGIGASTARSLAARGYDVVVVAGRDGDARALARCLRLDFGTQCIAVAADFETDAAASVRALRRTLRRANITGAVDIMVHSPPRGVLFETRSHKKKKRQQREPAVDPVPTSDTPRQPAFFSSSSSSSSSEAPPPSTPFPWFPVPVPVPVPDAPPPAVEEEDEDDEERDVLWDTALQTRCSASSHLAQLFGAEMASRGRGRCVFVVGGGTLLDMTPATNYDAALRCTARSTLEAADAYTRTLASSLRVDLARYGVGITVATRDVTNFLTPLRSWRPARRADRLSPGDRLVDAVLRGEDKITLYRGDHRADRFPPLAPCETDASSSEMISAHSVRHTPPRFTPARHHAPLL
ncbi:hypothetical protein CTAYLR_006068 [Chrysophaeum taylorii]|uniref:Uncharacterized protein n=1 Tax=Chrysophaeum taylorii TaxID=2483200 RepID=A0AAD7UJH8_9STRA|nr:hypothetical protein CTAYLR_006068 [Chrysophaeum taylorii]